MNAQELLRWLSGGDGDGDGNGSDERAQHEACVDLIVAGCKQHADTDAALGAYLRTLAPELAYLRPDVAAVVVRALAMEVTHRRDSAAALADIMSGVTLARCVTLAAVVERVLAGAAPEALALTATGDPDAVARRARGNNGGYV